MDCGFNTLIPPLSDPKWTQSSSFFSSLGNPLKMESKALKCILQAARLHWRIPFIIITPLALLFLLFIKPSEKDQENAFKCAYVIIIVALFWMVEALPLAITSFLPMVLLPLLKVQPAAKVAPNYLGDLNMLFLGGLMISIAVEYCNLHKRIALRVILSIGSSPTRIVLGIMLTSAFLSMWMSNTATTAMMVPIVLAVLEELQKSNMNFRKSMARLSVKSLGRQTLSKSSVDKPAASSVSFKIPAEQDANTESEKLEIEPSDASHDATDAENDYKKAAGDEFASSEDGEEGTAAEEEEEQEIGPDPDYKDRRRLHLLAIAYASNIGGIGTITGSAPNLILLQNYEMKENKLKMQHVLTFPSWMFYNFPSLVLNLIIAWMYLVTFYLGVPEKIAFWRPKKSADEIRAMRQKSKDIEKLLRSRYDSLGPVSFHEAAVGTLFLAVVLLWLFRNPGVFPGWGDLFTVEQATGNQSNNSTSGSGKVGRPKSTHYVTDSVAALLIVILMFIVPRDPSFLFGREPKAKGTLLCWKYTQSRFPWGVILLMGAGFAISNAANVSKLDKWIGLKLNILKTWPRPLMLFMTIFVTGFVTEVASNAAIANVVIPITLTLAEEQNFHPLYLSLPATIACSFAFMLPVATPPNAIAQAAGGDSIKILDMVKVGFFLNVSCIFVHFLVHISWGDLLFDYDVTNWDRNMTANGTGRLWDSFDHEVVRMS